MFSLATEFSERTAQYKNLIHGYLLTPVKNPGLSGLHQVMVVFAPGADAGIGTGVPASAMRTEKS